MELRCPWAALSCSRSSGLVAWLGFVVAFRIRAASVYVGNAARQIQRANEHQSLSSLFESSNTLNGRFRRMLQEEISVRLSPLVLSRGKVCLLVATGDGTDSTRGEERLQKTSATRTGQLTALQPALSHGLSPDLVSRKATISIDRAHNAHLNTRHT